jgi:hypothetical protein
VIVEPSGHHAEGSVRQNQMIARRHQRQVFAGIVLVVVSWNALNDHSSVRSSKSSLTCQNDVTSVQVPPAPLHVVAEDHEHRVVVFFPETISLDDELSAAGSRILPFHLK